MLSLIVICPACLVITLGGLLFLLNGHRRGVDLGERKGGGWDVLDERKPKEKNHKKLKRKRKQQQ